MDLQGWLQQQLKICEGMACTVKASFLPKLPLDLRAYYDLHQGGLRCATTFIALGRRNQTHRRIIGKIQLVAILPQRSATYDKNERRMIGVGVDEFLRA